MTTSLELEITIFTIKYSQFVNCYHLPILTNFFEFQNLFLVVNKRIHTYILTMSNIFIKPFIINFFFFQNYTNNHYGTLSSTF